MFGLKIAEVLIIFATIMGPILAVQSQKFIERWREKKERKLRIFQTLMATRAARVSPGHVEALNMIDIVFYEQGPKEKKVVEAWRLYQGHLNNMQMPQTPESLASWGKTGDDLFTELLYAMAQALDYSFDKVYLKRGIYSPRAHGEDQLAQLTIRDSLVKILSGERPLPMKVVSVPVSESDVQIQRKIWDGWLECLAGNRSIKIRLEENKANDDE
jgi:Family of unknown function (DUF6680)